MGGQLRSVIPLTIDQKCFSSYRAGDHGFVRMGNEVACVMSIYQNSMTRNIDSKSIYQNSMTRNIDSKSIYQTSITRNNLLKDDV